MAQQNQSEWSVVASYVVDMDSALPEAPDIVKSKTNMFETWEFANEIYSALGSVNVHCYRQRNKLRRALAPGLLISLKLIALYAMSAAKESSSQAAGEKQEHNVLSEEFVKLGLQAIDRFEIWTAQTKYSKMRRNDINNNHTVLNLITRYQNHSQSRFWYVDLAVDNAISLHDGMKSWCTNLITYFPMSFLSHRSKVGQSLMFVKSVFTVVLRFVDVVPEAGLNLNPSIKGKLSSLERLLSEYDLTAAKPPDREKKRGKDTNERKGRGMRRDKDKDMKNDTMEDTV